MDFRPFEKIPRLMRDIIITEKIDGTNGVIAINHDGEFSVGSRNRWITTEDDNQGFAKWAYANQDELMGLGFGYHFGEWWGQGIQRGYGLKEKRFSLFNVSRWYKVRPACCHVVPILYCGAFEVTEIRRVLNTLREHGSRAVPGFTNPEGVIVYHSAAGQYFKMTLENDEKGKG